jgi:hypothetical protein
MSAFLVDRPLFAGGQQLDTSPEKFGFLTESTSLLGDFEALQKQFQNDGYLYIKGFFKRDDVMAVRLEIARRLQAEGALDEGAPIEQCVAKPGLNMAFRPDISNASQTLQDLIYGSAVMSFYSGLLGGETTHYDFTWLRVVAPGKGTYPHCDIVYMGRGTQNIRTLWVPYGDVPLSVGGLLILENSHQLSALHDEYGKLDVDSVCENKQGLNQVASAGFVNTGAIDEDFLALQTRYGGRWLTANYEMGDLLTFGMKTIHGSLDNGSSQIRISSDSRYQLAADPVDERWVGEHPIAHGNNAKRSLIC